MRFRTRTFLLSFIPFAILLAASFWVVQGFVQSTVRDGLLGSLRESELEIARVDAKADVENSRFLKIAGENASLKAGMQLVHSHPGNRAARLTVGDQLRELGQHMGFDFLLVSGPDGAPMAGVIRDTDDQPGHPSQLVPLDLSLTQHSEKGLLQIGNRLFQFASVPVDEGEENIGSLAVGEYFDFSRLTTQAVLMREGKVIKSNVPDVSTAEVESALGGCAGESECDFRLRSASWISVPMQAFGGGYTLRSLENVDGATAPVQSRLRSLFLLMAFGSVLVALLCSMVSSNSIVKPIAHVVSHLKNAESTGELPEFTIDPSWATEIQELAESYNRAALSVKGARESLQAAYVEFVGSLANALDARDGYTSGHSSRVSQLSCLMAAAMGLDPAEVDRVRTGAVLHDIGKIGIADSVLQKPGRLTAEEFAIVKEHPVIGRRILEVVRGLAPYLDAVELHHENWDGTGYPNGHAGQEIPVNARIIHVADAYDAMTSNRSYRRGMTHEEAMQEIVKHAGKQFDPQVVAIFVQLSRDIVVGELLEAYEHHQFAELEAAKAK